MTAPRFAMITQGEFCRLKADEQNAVFDEAEALYPNRKTSQRNPAERWKAVSQAKALFWDAPRPQSLVRKIAAAIAYPFGIDDPPPNPVSRTISAAEANTWLRTLPPYPIAGG